ncbi:hypothetical protein V6N12_071013 [Hibiscus sabdariffa]|uniref:Uncharacterized protein n=1 Tax=Hibiscus sabdariffa TaxID=183260 RepID=A0ABR2FJ33_9ROSI
MFRCRVSTLKHQLMGSEFGILCLQFCVYVEMEGVKAEPEPLHEMPDDIGIIVSICIGNIFYPEGELPMTTYFYMKLPSNIFDTRSVPSNLDVCLLPKTDTYLASSGSKVQIRGQSQVIVPSGINCTKVI